jgi:hypothetical protein
MAILTLIERIENVQSAIQEVLTSQELTTQAGSVVRARLDFLYKMERDLLNQYELLNRAGGFQNKVRFSRTR